jgi:hypothetical protein
MLDTLKRMEPSGSAVRIDFLHSKWTPLPDRVQTLFPRLLKTSLRARNQDVPVFSGEVLT